MSKKIDLWGFATLKVFFVSGDQIEFPVVFLVILK